MQRLQAFVDARKRSIEAAEDRYDVQAAVTELRELAAPLHSPDRFPSSWKNLYLEYFYRDVAAFLLHFVAVHLEICFTQQDRDQGFDVLFDREVVPSSRAIGALASKLSATNTRTAATNRTTEEDAGASITQCVRLLEKIVTTGGVQDIVTEMLIQEQTPSTLTAQQALSLSKYRLLAQIPPELCASKQLQYVVAHKLLLRKSIDDFFFWRVLVDVMVQYGGHPCQSPLAAVFDVVLTRWSQSDFAVNTEYTVNAAVCFFLRYSLQKLSKDGGESFMQQDWITKLCKGVQDHMGHSIERVRALGMRVGESLSHIIASEQPLDFGLKDEDPVEIYGCPVLPEELEKGIANLNLDAQEESLEQSTSGTSGDKEKRRRRKNSKKRLNKPFTLDPDELVLSDEDEANASDSDAESESSFDSADSDSDLSLEAYDLEDDEEDLTAKRPLYLKDLITSLLADDDREKTEVALNEAESLIRRQPRDLKDKAHEVVRALLRLEDKYNTPQFVSLRSQALATACTLAPTQTLPYLTSQALEREQLLQSRIDVLQAMTSAAQELSERGGYQHPKTPKTLLNEQVQSDLKTRTMQSLKTRRWGYRRDPLAGPKRNAFAPYALQFFSPLLFGYVDYVRKHSATPEKARSEVEQTFLAHLLHALASFVECAGHAPQTIAMAKCLLEFAWSERSSTNAEVRRQVLFSLSRVLLVVPPTLLRQEVGEALAEVAPWLRQVQNHDPDAGCREAAQLLSSFAPVPTASLSLM
ncbi:hypothetical protein AM588_10010372 [Phytophthora nicotianae]|nr:hypothetical protein AM588_10010372 [Phytophthora nicotianae]